MSDKKRWKIEFEKYLTKKMKDMFGDDDDDLEIKVLNIEDTLDYDNIDDDTTIDELATYYAFTIMTEEFEKSQIIKDELKKRDCTVELDIGKETAVLNVYYKEQNELPYVDVKFNVISDDLIIDFEEEDF